jgi:hypothetical protein
MHQRNPVAEFHFKHGSSPLVKRSNKGKIHNHSDILCTNFLPLCQWLHYTYVPDAKRFSHRNVSEEGIKKEKKRFSISHDPIDSVTATHQQ